MSEVWKPVPECPLYEVSSEGRIRSYHKKGKPKVMAQRIHHTGYYRVNLTVNDKRSTRNIHQMVCQAFHENPESKPYVNHIDGNKTNNRPTNLEWCTPSENMIHAYETGLTKTGEEKIIYNYGSINVEKLKGLHATGIPTSARELARLFGIPKEIIKTLLNIRR